MNKNKNLAFTLAEVLIVIGIIGVVAALTLPNLNHATGDKEKVTRVKKAYSTLSEALDRAQAIYGNFDTWFTDLSTEAEMSERFGNRITEFLKISKNCGLADLSCFPSGYAQQLSGGAFGGISINTNSKYKFITTDGTSVSIDAYSHSSDGATAQIFIDIDGPNKGSYTWGKDIFMFYARSNNLITTSCKPLANVENRDYCNLSEILSNANTNSVGLYASDWILNYDNADYLKITDANGTCDNGNVVTESNPSCN